jgi:hypothetical protein
MWTYFSINYFMEKPKTISRCQDYSQTREDPDERILIKSSKKSLKFTNKSTSSRYSYISKSETKKEDRKERHNLYKTSIILNSSSMITIIKNSYKKKLST